MTQLVYIGGYGRSGSTLLESLLTTRGDFLACGEIVSCLRKRVERECTCGKPRTECSVWRSLYTTPGALRGASHEDLTLSLLRQASKRYSFLIDSSKTAWGALSAPFKLRRKLGPAFHMVHVVRDPRGVCCSNADRAWQRRTLTRSRNLRHLVTVLGWSAANLSCELFHRLYPQQYTLVRYEDLVESHDETLATLLSKLKSEVTPPSKKGGSDNRHQLFGNQGRYRALAPDALREDRRWTTDMPAIQQRLVLVATWPLRKRYGYGHAMP